MNEPEAREILDARVRAGGRLVAAQQADLRTIKQLRDRCHEAGIPAMLGAASSGG